MAQTSVLKDANITGLDAVPPVFSTTGEGSRGYLQEIDGTVAAVSADAIGSTYRLCRVPTTAKIKNVVLNSAIASAGAGDINIAYSDGNDGTPPALAGTIVQVASADNKLFGAASTLVAQANVNVTFAGSFTLANRNQPLWKVLGLASDPGGYFDFLIKVTTAVTTGGAVGLKVDLVV